MNDLRATPSAGDCPDLDAVNAVLDREAAEEVGVALRRHVAGCAACGERFGALFEVDSLAPAVARGAQAVRRLRWVKPLLAAAALIVAASLLVTRARERPDDRGAAAPRLVASRRVETEIVVDAAGVHTSIRHAGGGDAGSFEYESTRSGRTAFRWSRWEDSR